MVQSLEEMEKISNSVADANSLVAPTAGFTGQASQLCLWHHDNGHLLDDGMLFLGRHLTASSAVIPDTWCTQSERDQHAVLQ